MNILGWINRINDLYGTETAPKRFDTTQWLRPGFRGGQLVDHGPEGVRQGYRVGMSVKFAKKQKKLDAWLKNKKQVSSTELTKKLTELDYKSPTSKMFEMKQDKSKWFKKTKFIQDPNPAYGDLMKGEVYLSKGNLTVANKYAQLLNNLSPDDERYVSSPNYKDLPPDERVRITNIAKNRDWVFKNCLLYTSPSPRD